MPSCLGRGPGRGNRWVDGRGRADVGRWPQSCRWSPVACFACRPRRPRAQTQAPGPRTGCGRCGTGWLPSSRRRRPGPVSRPRWRRWCRRTWTSPRWSRRSRRGRAWRRGLRPVRRAWSPSWSDARAVRVGRTWPTTSRPACPPPPPPRRTRSPSPSPWTACRRWRTPWVRARWTRGGPASSPRSSPACPTRRPARSPPTSCPPRARAPPRSCARGCGGWRSCATPPRPSSATRTHAATVGSSWSPLRTRWPGSRRTCLPTTRPRCTPP